MPSLDVPPTAAVVAVDSSWYSRINWTQAVGIAASIGVIWGIELPPEKQLEIVAGIQGVVALVTWVLKTWFTNSVSPASMRGAPSIRSTEMVGTAVQLGGTQQPVTIRMSTV